jgi:SAM-dependent methyltransferase
MDTFTYWGTELRYCREEYNHSGLNERAVEIPIAQWFIDQCRKDDHWAPGLEVGAVLQHYERPIWMVLDRYEPGATLNCDVFDHHETYDWIVAVSTLEHVRWDEPQMERHPDGSMRALEHLHTLLRPGGRMLVTIPMGWQPFLDSTILDGRLPVKPERECTLVRLPKTDPIEWFQTRVLGHRRYAATSIWAESVWVAEFSA